MSACERTNSSPPRRRAEKRKEVFHKEGRTKMVTRLMAGWIVGCLVWLTAGSDADAQQKMKVNFRLCWTASGMDTPYFLGVDRGFYAEEGLDVEINEVLGSGTCFKLMSQG